MNANGKFTASAGLLLLLAVSLHSLGLGQIGGASADSGRDRPIALPKRVAGVGVVEPVAGTVEFSPQMPGVIAKIAVHEGDHVTRGQLLVELVNDDLKAKVAQSEAQLAIKRADLTRLRNGPLPEEIEKAAAQLREEESSLKLLQWQEGRRESLARAGAVSTASLNTAASSLAASRERLGEIA